MRSLGIRAEADTSGERLPKQIRNAEKEKIPVMAVVGEKEVESNSLSIRVRAAGGQSKDLGAIAVAEVIERMKEAIANHSNF
jgi:threonyl-tRNA synthetase